MTSPASVNSGIRSSTARHERSRVLVGIGCPVASRFSTRSGNAAPTASRRTVDGANAKRAAHWSTRMYADAESGPDTAQTLVYPGRRDVTTPCDDTMATAESLTRPAIPASGTWRRLASYTRAGTE